jgi:hypothetical protein
MLLSDVLAPYLDGVEAVVDATPPEWDLPRQLRRLDPVPLRRPEPPDAAPASGELRLVEARAAERDALCEALAAAPVGATVVLLTTDAPGEASWPALLDATVRAGCQVLQVAPVEGAPAGTGVVCRRTDVLLPRRGHFGEVPPDSADATELPALLRLVGEAAFGDAWTRASRSRLEQLAARVAELESDLAAAQDATKAAQAAEKAALAAQAASERREEKLRKSLSVRVGRKAGAALRATGLRGRRGGDPGPS